MITEYIRYRIPAEAAAEADVGGGTGAGAGAVPAAGAGAAAFEAAYARAATSLAAAPQCVEYELTRCVDEPEHYILRIVWTSAADHTAGFRGGPHFRAFFTEIKPYVSGIEEMRHYEHTSVKGAGGSTPTLYDWLGGAEALERLTAVFYTHVSADALIGPLFARMDPAHPHHVAVWLGEVFGGPDRYTREHGGYGHMVSRHLGKAVTEAQRRRWVSLLMDAADEAGLPADPEFRAVFAGYIEWGTRLALANSQPGATPTTDSPVPHWGWGVTPPYRHTPAQNAG